ncbi:MAG: DNA recombination protein RmuC [Myxococcota bacterium]
MHTFLIVSCLFTLCAAAVLTGLLVGLRRRLQDLQQKHSDANTRLQQAQESLQQERIALATHQEQVKSIPQLKQELQDKQQQLQQMQQQLSECKQSLAARQEALQQLQHAQKQLKDSFAATCAEALRHNNQAFLQLAQTSLKQLHETSHADLNKRQVAISHVLDPLKTSLGQLTTQLNQLESSRKGAYEGLRQQVQNLLQAQQHLHKQTQSLSQALHNPTARGQWGELQLRRVVELAGMLSHCDFVQQPHLSDPDHPLRPDLLVHLPGNKCIVVDAKAPLEAYLQACEQTDPQTREKCFQQHARHVRDHVRQLSQKSYWSRLEHTPEFVVLFLPGEGFFSAASQHDPHIIEAAAQQGVILATPTTLIALLKAVSYGWQQETLAHNVQQVSQLAKTLQQRLDTALQHFAKLSRHLHSSVQAYNQTVSSLQSRVLPTARKLSELSGGPQVTCDQEPTAQPLSHTKLKEIDNTPKSLPDTNSHT